MNPLRLLKDSESIILSELSAVDTYEISLVEQRLIGRIKAELSEAKLYIRDLETSNTLESQQKIAKKLHIIIRQIEKNILKLSEYNIFSAVDIAQISAHLYQIIEDTL